MDERIEEFGGAELPLETKSASEILSGSTPETEKIFEATVEKRGEKMEELLARIDKHTATLQTTSAAQVKDDAHAALVDFIDQLKGIIHRAKFRRDVLVIGNVVPKIRLRRGEEGRAPNGLESQVSNVIQLLNDALNVAYAVAIAVHERARIDVIDACLVIPGDAHGYNSSPVL